MWILTSTNAEVGVSQNNKNTKKGIRGPVKLILSCVDENA